LDETQTIILVYFSVNLRCRRLDAGVDVWAICVGISVNHDEFHDFFLATMDVHDGLSLLLEKSIKR
jgi:hypothetical protein